MADGHCLCRIDVGDAMRLAPFGQVLPATLAVERRRIGRRAASRAGDACGRLWRFRLAKLSAARFTKSPRRLNRGRASRAAFQLVCIPAPLNKRLAAPLAVAQPFREIYIAPVAVHHKKGG